jgi:hypothetical protein
MKRGLRRTGGRIHHAGRCINQGALVAAAAASDSQYSDPSIRVAT